MVFTVGLNFGESRFFSSVLPTTPLSTKSCLRRITCRREMSTIVTDAPCRRSGDICPGEVGKGITRLGVQTNQRPMVRMKRGGVRVGHGS